MPKYYVTDPMVTEVVIEAQDPVHACKLAILYRLPTVCSGLGCYYTVSEKGFGYHAEDDVFESHFIMSKLIK